MAALTELHVPLFKVFMSTDVDPELLRVLHSGYVTEGPKVKEFEKALSEFIGTQVLTVNSGTSALTLALRLAGVGPGDEVISTPMTCQATNTPIMGTGAKIVWADINPRTGLIDPESIADRITSKTKVLMTVDWGGAPCDYAAIWNVIKGKNILMIEDAAHALGASYLQEPVGTIADYTCFSFQAIKHLTTVDGGALTAQWSLEDYDRARRLRWFGIDREEETKEFRGEVDVEEWGYKFHMNDVNATIGLANLQWADDIISRHRVNARILDESIDTEMYTNTNPEYMHQHSHWLYTTLLPDHNLRERFKEHMEKRGIQVSQVHWRNDRLTTFKEFKRDDLPGVDEFSRRMICVPVHWASDPYRVARAMNAFRSRI